MFTRVARATALPLLALQPSHFLSVYVDAPHAASGSSVDLYRDVLGMFAGVPVSLSVLHIPLVGRLLGSRVEGCPQASGKYHHIATNIGSLVCQNVQTSQFSIFLSV